MGNKDMVVNGKNGNGTARVLRIVWMSLGLVLIVGGWIWAVAINFNRTDHNAQAIGQNFQEIQTIKTETKTMFGKLERIDERTLRILKILEQ